MDGVDETKSKERKVQERNVFMNPPRILLAEDDKEMRSLLALKLRNAGYEVSESPDGFNLLDHLGSFLLPDAEEHEPVDLIISDIRMPGVSGLRILEGVHEMKGFPPMILITAFGDAKTHEEADRFGVAAMFDKPFNIDDLLAKVKELVPLDDLSPPL
jgi:DNA-binding response OmpR family regulator